MASSLERTFTRLQVFHRGSTLQEFLEGYLLSDDLLSLRLASRTLSRSAELNRAAFKTIYIPTPPPPGRRQLFDALERVARSCQNCVIQIAFPPKPHSPWPTIPFDPAASALPSKADRHTPDHEMRDSCCPYMEPPVAWKFMVQRKPDNINQDLLGQWLHVLSLFPYMQSLTIACNGDPGWPRCTDIEALIIILRISLERTNPKHLHTVRFSPIHAMGIMHLRWYGAGVYGEAPSSRDVVWQRLKTLELQIINPFVSDQLSESQRQIFTRVFQDYLRSFRRTLTRLNLFWIGAEGPNPFAMEGGAEDTGLLSSWHCLEELWLGNVATYLSITADILRRAPGLQKLRVWSHEIEDGAGDRTAVGTWVDPLVPIQSNRIGAYGTVKTLALIPKYLRSEESIEHCTIRSVSSRSWPEGPKHE